MEKFPVNSLFNRELLQKRFVRGRLRHPPTSPYLWGRFAQDTKNSRVSSRCADVPGPESAYLLASCAATSIFSLWAKNSVPIADQLANAVGGAGAERKLWAPRPETIGAALEPKGR